MKFLEKELIFVTQEKFYQVQLSQKQKIDYESYQLVLNLVDKKFLRSFSLKKILLGYPYVKLFSSVVPTPDKKEYQNLADFFLPKEIFSHNLPQYIQIFPINDSSSRYVHYQLTDQGKALIQKFPFQCRWEFMFSFFARKLFLNANQLEKNLALFFENEIILVQKYFSNLHYFANSRNLTQNQFLEFSEHIFPFEPNENYYFKSKLDTVSSKEIAPEEAPSRNSFSNLGLSFSWGDFFYRKPALIKRLTTRSKKIRLLKLLPKMAVVFILFSTSYFFYNLFYFHQLKKELKEIRNYTITTQDEVTNQLATKGKKILQGKVLAELIKEESIAPQVLFENLDNWIGKNSWLVSLQTFSKEGQKQVKIQLVSTNPELSKQKQTNLNSLFKNKKITIQKKGGQRKGKQKIYFFDILVN